MSFIGLGFCFFNPLNWEWKLQFLLPFILFQEELHFSLTYQSLSTIKNRTKSIGIAPTSGSKAEKVVSTCLLVRVR